MRPVTRHAAVHPARPRRRRRRWIIAVTVAVVVVVLVAAAAVGYDVLLRTKGSPRQTAAAYLAGWQRGSYAAMDKVSVNVPRSGLAGPLRQVDAQLGVRHIRLVPGRVTTQGGTAQERFTVTADLASGHAWTYRGQLRLVRRDRRWWVNWSPSAIYPGLRPGQRFALTGAWPARAPVLADDGTVLSSPSAFAESGSHLAAGRQRGAGHRRPGQGARRPLQGR